jgi:hypothetical protein
MTETSDREAYLKGYEDATRSVTGGGAAATVTPPAPTVPPPTSMDGTSTTGTPARKRGGGFGEKLQKGIGFAFGWLILFPVFFGLVGGCFSWLSGDAFFGTWAAIFAGVAFAVALFTGIVLVGWKVFINLWPVLLVVAGIAFAVKKLFF